MKYGTLTTARSIDTAGVAHAIGCDSLHIKRTGLSGVKPTGVTKKCDSDVPLPFTWGSAGIRFP